MPELHVLISALALLTYVLTTRASRERRAPAAAIAWVLGIALLPYLVLPLYFVFGRRKFRRVARAARPPPQPRHWASDLTAAFGLAPPRPARTRFHADGARAREALLATIRSARAQLDVATFLVGHDALGDEVVAALAERVRAGVEVRVLVDGAGALLGSRRALAALRDAGVVLGLFRPPFGLHAQGPRNLRNHRKLVVADRERLWSGGRNLAAEYFLGRAGAAPWIDLSFDLAGAVAEAAAEQFESDWRTAHVVRRTRHPRTAAAARAAVVDVPPPPADGDRVEFVPSGPDQNEDTVQALLVAGCYRAERRILAVTPYFVPDDALKNALRLAARRGVEVVLVVPARSNHRLADLARGRALRELAGAGATIRMSARMVHAKAVVFDDSLAVAGSVNLDVRSLLLNYEAATLFFGRDEIRWLAAWIETLPAAERYCAEPPGLLRDVGEGLLLALAFQL
ncbi:MAG TPA: phospholipase D-like domain-containing protein [Dokdonella sp.]